MKRLCIFCFYDKNGVVDSYIEYLLNDLRSCSAYIIVVVNGSVNFDGRLILQKYSNQIIIRRNMGFDGGAYKEILTCYMSLEELKQYDEIVLCNDTFYGPFIPFEKIFKKMENQVCDFWGLNYIDNIIAEHIQSYFLVFKKRIRKEDLLEFFEMCVDKDSVRVTDLIAQFEGGMFSFLKNKGYKSGVYTQPNNVDIYVSPNYAVKEYGFPIMKKKCFDYETYHEDNVVDLLQFLFFNAKYDINMILENAKRLYDFECNQRQLLFHTSDKIEKKMAFVLNISRENILSFLGRQKSVYIYGIGNFGKRFYYGYHYLINNFCGFIVSSDQETAEISIQGYPVLRITDIKDKGIGIVVALGRGNTDEVRPSLKEFENVLYFFP